MSYLRKLSAEYKMKTPLSLVTKWACLYAFLGNHKEIVSLPIFMFPFLLSSQPCQRSQDNVMVYITVACLLSIYVFNFLDNVRISIILFCFFQFSLLVCR